MYAAAILVETGVHSRGRDEQARPSGEHASIGSQERRGGELPGARGA